MKKLIFVFFTICIAINLSAQDTKLPISIAYYTPYAINPGLKIGTAFQLKTINTSGDKLQTLSVNPQIGFWNSSIYDNNIHRTLVADAHLNYKRYTMNQQFYGLTGIGLSYQLELQRTGLNLDLSTGDSTSDTKSIHSFIPMFNLGFGKDYDRLGYYFKGFVGQRFAISDSNSLFAGAELGFTFFLIKE